MDRFFCVSTGFFRWKSIFHLFPSCYIRKFLPVFFYMYMSLSPFTYACICARTHARAKYIMYGCSHLFSEASKNIHLQLSIFQQFTENMKNFRKK